MPGTSPVTVTWSWGTRASLFQPARFQSPRFRRPGSGAPGASTLVMLVLFVFRVLVPPLPVFPLFPVFQPVVVQVSLVPLFAPVAVSAVLPGIPVVGVMGGTGVDPALLAIAVSIMLLALLRCDHRLGARQRYGQSRRQQNKSKIPASLVHEFSPLFLTARRSQPSPLNARASIQRRCLFQRRSFLRC